MGKSRKTPNYGVEHADRNRSWILDKVCFFKRKHAMLDQLEFERKKALELRKIALLKECR